jgi:hypothetical protein
MIYLVILLFVLLNLLISWFTYDTYSKLFQLEADLKSLRASILKLEEEDIAVRQPVPRKPKKVVKKNFNK